MAFDGPQKADFGNIVPLNQEFLELLRKEKSLRRCIAELPESQRHRLVTLDRVEAHHLAQTPFLLFSFREHDDVYWERILTEPVSPGLFQGRVSDDVRTLMSSALGVIWHLAQRDPFTLRLFSGAPLAWCETIADLALHRLLDAVCRSGDLPVLRFGDHREMWRALLDGGISGRVPTRMAAQLSGLQIVLSRSQQSRQLARAARSLRTTAFRVADENDPK
jgi:hypothetical protein